MICQSHDKIYINFKAIEDRLSERSGTEVRIVQDRNGSRPNHTSYTILSGSSFGAEVGSIRICTTYSPEHLGDSDMELDLRLRIQRGFGFLSEVPRGRVRAVLGMPCDPSAVPHGHNPHTYVTYRAKGLIKLVRNKRKRILERLLPKGVIFTPQVLS